MKERIKVYLYNKTMKEIDMSDFSYISEDVFSERTDIVKVVLPEGVKEIGNNAFENCIHLEEVVCPKSLQKIDSEAFIDCISLKKLIMTQHQLRWMQVHLRGVIIFKNYGFRHCSESVHRNMAWAVLRCFKNYIICML